MNEENEIKQLDPQYHSKWKYHPEHGAVICKSFNEEKELGHEWKDSLVDVGCTNPSSSDEKFMRPRPICHFIQSKQEKAPEVEVKLKRGRAKA